MTQRTAFSLLAAASLAAATLIPSAALAQTVETGIRVVVANSLPHWEADRGGFWAVVPAGRASGKWTAQSAADEATIPPGNFDFYWIANEDHAETPLLMAEDVTVRNGTVTEIRIQTGIIVELADWVPPLDPDTGRLIAVLSETMEVVNRTAGNAMVLPPARYGLYRDDDINDDRRPVWVGTYDIEAPFTGVGLELRSDPEITVVRPLPGSPAEAAGILPGDIIAAVDGTDTMRTPFDDTVALIRGPSGTPVVLTISRAGTAGPIEITVQRTIVEAQNIARLDAGIRLVIDPALPPLGPGGWWGVTFDGEDPADPAARADAADEVLLVGHTTYDVYWTADGDTPPRLVAAGVEAEAGILEVTVGPEAPADAPTAAPPKPRLPG